MPIGDPFESWWKALSHDSTGSLDFSGRSFDEAADLFFKSGTENPNISRAYFEYSTLMDAFSRVQEARRLEMKADYEKSLEKFGRAAEILRSTVHFGFLSGYISACATLETALKIEDLGEKYDALKNAITLFEQSKLALSFRDERHPILRGIDSLIKYCITDAFLVESKALMGRGLVAEANRKSSESATVSKDHETLKGEIGASAMWVNYFLVEDWKRARSSGFVLTYIDKDSMLLQNVGSNTVRVDTVANKAVNVVINAKDSTIHRIASSAKGRIRVGYFDTKSGQHYDEGCLLSI